MIDTFEKFHSARQMCAQRYPVMHEANKHGNGRETPAHRRDATSNAKNRDLAWDDLLSLDGTKQIPADYRKTFRQAE